ncbi:hypothetical protein D3C71_1248150 [compost metagenome]
MELVVGHQRCRHVNRRTFDLGRPTGHVAQEVDGQLHVHHLGHRCAFTVVQAFQLRQQLGVALHQVGEFPQQVLPLPGAGAGPGRIVERLAGGEHRTVDIFRRCPWYHAQHLTGGRVVQGHGLAVGGLDPVTADEHARGALDECRSGGKQVWERHWRGLLLFVRTGLSQCLCQLCFFGRKARSSGVTDIFRVTLTSINVANCDDVRRPEHNTL